MSILIHMHAQYQNTLNTKTHHASCTLMTMLLVAATILSLLGSFATSQDRNSGGRVVVVGAKDSGNQPADSKARCLLNCGFHRMDPNRMDSNGAFKVSRKPKYNVRFYFV